MLFAILKLEAMLAAILKKNKSRGYGIYEEDITCQKLRQNPKIFFSGGGHL
jgi:hypothetical protein